MPRCSLKFELSGPPETGIGLGCIPTGSTDSVRHHVQNYETPHAGSNPARSIQTSETLVLSYPQFMKILPLPKLTVEKQQWFKSFVAEKSTDECWLWTGAKNATGYGTVNLFGVTFRANRVAYFIATGSDPESLVVRHSCDNPSCVNPNHLIAGTSKENTADIVARNRRPCRKGSNSHLAKLTDAQVEEILSRKNEPRAVIGSDYGISAGYVSKIIRGHKWCHKQVVS